ncbi:MAG TPA: PKD domain-containing protein, partial [Candidatus Hydrogenedentes bacterium]|nr:PKD domain-containing protein [Candidatus Hydrogenedentota bacterium]
DSWYWDFGDGGWSDEWSPTYTYNSPGTHTARLHLQRNCGAEVTRDLVIEVICEPPVASFEASPTSGDTPLEVTFTNTSTNTDSWYWDFGDGGWSDEWSPSHTYSYPGIYTALLHLQRNCGAEVTRDVVIEVICEPPVAGFEASPTSGDTPLEVTFTNTSTNTDSWYWDFGDGGWSDEWSPTYTYNSPGTHTARLHLQRNCGAEVTRDLVIEVICEPPVASFEASPTSGNAPLEVTFTNTSTNADYYSWDFGDGNGSDEWSPTHTYYDPGTYTARLYVYRDCGDDEEDTHEVVINVTPPSVPHPADVNVDFSIKINEAIAYLTGWQQGTNPIAFAIRAAYLWQNGEKYSYDGSAAPPMCWVLAPEVLP